MTDRTKTTNKGGGDGRAGDGKGAIGDNTRLQQRKQREAEALRANLAKRKAQKRGRRSSGEAS